MSGLRASAAATCTDALPVVEDSTGGKGVAFLASDNDHHPLIRFPTHFCGTRINSIGIAKMPPKMIPRIRLARVYPADSFSADEIPFCGWDVLAIV